jgi:hypothetical protein
MDIATWIAIIILGIIDLASFIVFIANITDPQAILLCWVSGVITFLFAGAIIIIFTRGKVF